MRLSQKGKYDRTALPTPTLNTKVELNRGWFPHGLHCCSSVWQTIQWRGHGHWFDARVGAGFGFGVFVLLTPSLLPPGLFVPLRGWFVVTDAVCSGVGAAGGSGCWAPPPTLCTVPTRTFTNWPAQCHQIPLSTHQGGHKVREKIPEVFQAFPEPSTYFSIGYRNKK